MKRYMILCLLLAGIESAVFAAQNPQQLVQDTTKKITSTLAAEQDAIAKNPARLYEIVDEVVLPHFDFERMSSWVLGKYWRTASEDERRKFTGEFRDLLVRTYAKALNDNYNKAIDILPMREKAGGNEVIVRTEVQQDSGFPIPIDYKMYLKGDTWKVYDVSVDNISLVTNYRTSFAQEIRSDGLPKLIERLAQRNRDAVAQ